MVFPALLAAAGYGAQAYGSSQRTNAQQNAESAYQRWLDRFHGDTDRANAQLQQMLGQTSQEYQGNQDQLANSFAPTDRVNAYQGGAQAENNHLQQVLSLMQSQQPHAILPTGGEQGVFSQAVTREQGRNAGFRDRLITANSDAAGINSLEQNDANNIFNFTNQAGALNRRITRAQQLYQLGQAMRERALARGAGQHQADLASAQLAGNGWMMAGGLLGAGAQGLGSYQANQGASAANPSFGNSGATDLGGGSGSNPAAYDPSYNPNQAYT